MQWQRKQVPHRAGAAGVVIGLIVGLPAVFAPVYAASPWVVHPTVGLQGSAHDNVQLRERDGDTSYQGTAEAGVIVQQISQTRMLRGHGVAGYTGYRDDPDAPDDGDFQSFLGEAEYLTQRSLWGLTGTYLRDNTRVDAAAPDAIVDPGADIDTVTVSETVRRYRATIRPSVEHFLSPRLSLGAGYVGTYRSHNGQGRDRTEFFNHQTELRARYRWSEITTVGLGVQGGFFRPREEGRAMDDDDRSVNTYALVADIEHALSERSTLRVSGGVRQSDPVGARGDRDSETGFTGRVEATTRGWNWNGMAFVERRLLPDHQGVLRETDQLIVRAARDITPRLEAAFSGRAFRTRSIEEQFGEDGNEEYASLLPSLAYRLTPEWSVTAEYRYQFIDRAGEDGDAQGNSVYLRFDYAPRQEAQWRPTMDGEGR
ncbi:MAG: hypothetical protein WED00_11880 [Aquisalimonadaceae bacterium]